MVIKVILVQKSFLKAFKYETIGRLAAQTQFIRNRMAYPNLIDCQFFKELKMSYIRMYDYFSRGEDYHLVFPDEFLNNIPDIEEFCRKLTVVLSKNLKTSIKVTVFSEEAEQAAQELEDFLIKLS